MYIYIYARVWIGKASVNIDNHWRMSKGVMALSDTHISVDGPQKGCRCDVNILPLCPDQGSFGRLEYTRAESIQSSKL